VKGFAQKNAIDLHEIFSHVAEITSIKGILSLVETKYFHIEQLDVNKTFLQRKRLICNNKNGMRSKGMIN